MTRAMTWTTLKRALGAATVRDAGGTAVVGASVQWASSDDAVATVSAGGVVTGRAVGVATITATNDGRSATAAVTVSAAPRVPVDSVRVTPSDPRVAVGQSAQLTATVLDASGNVLSGRPVTWSSSNPLVATVSATGVVNALLAGGATITATSGGKSATSSVSILGIIP